MTKDIKKLDCSHNNKQRDKSWIEKLARKSRRQTQLKIRRS